MSKTKPVLATPSQTPSSIVRTNPAQNPSRPPLIGRNGPRAGGY